MRTLIVGLGIALLASACKKSTSTPPPETPETDDTDVAVGPPDVITVETRDGVTLEADYWAGDPGAPGFVLLHMIPPSNDRSTWPRSFEKDLVREGYAVLAVDRRGAGGSEGIAVEAYTGPNGKYDVEACVLHLQAEGAGALAIIGASNGTTSMLDYAAWAPGEGLPEAAALGFMTGGAYTETNTAMSEVPSIPAAFTYSTAERDWSVDQQPLDPGTWSFLEYPDGDHGTLMFDAAPEVGDDLVAFFTSVLP
jgi:pimeloyl-ACP methyl ester carboxylesterase